MTLADELKRGPKMKANPMKTNGELAREMFRRGKTRSEIAVHFSVGHARVKDWLAWGRVA